MDEVTNDIKMATSYAAILYTDRHTGRHADIQTDGPMKALGPSQ